MLSFVGVGGAGCKVIETFYRKDIISSIISKIAFKGEGYIKGVAIDTSETITQLSAIPSENRVLIGSSRAKGHGTGGDVKMGEVIMTEELELAMNAVRKANVEKPEAFFLVAGLGGGTGTGGLPIIAKKIKETYGVPTLGILFFPSRNEGSLYIKNAIANLEKILRALDGAIVLDINTLTGRGEDVVSSHSILNKMIFNFFSVVEPMEILRRIERNISTISFLRLQEEHASIKEILEKMLRDYLYIDAEEMGEFHMLIYGDLDKVYGDSYARKWCKEKHGKDLNIVFRDDPGARYLNIGLIITGLKGIGKRYKDEILAKEKREKKSELEELLSEIKPLF
ncbi:MAG: hypothetical protein DRN95_05060 [Candidatus Hydrothermarchaeota archaeon]|nr:MAG: hypothetical protein DRN95_05060 [Candidatus Hydrothermarchaeota archaeon]